MIHFVNKNDSVWLLMILVIILVVEEMERIEGRVILYFRTGWTPRGGLEDKFKMLNWDENVLEKWM